MCVSVNKRRPQALVVRQSQAQNYKGQATRPIWWFDLLSWRAQSPGPVTSYIFAWSLFCWKSVCVHNSSFENSATQKLYVKENSGAWRTSQTVSLTGPCNSPASCFPSVTNQIPVQEFSKEDQNCQQPQDKTNVHSKLETNSTCLISFRCSSLLSNHCRQSIASYSPSTPLPGLEVTL